MGKTTGISWTDSTCNIWIGCDKVSAGCKHCYAEESTPVRVARVGCEAIEAQETTDDAPAVKARAARAPLEMWGPKAARRETKGWEANLRKWNREATASGKVHRVFAQSLSDTFEDRRDLDMLRERFFMAIEAAPALTFQLLTKRPEHIREMVPESWMASWPAHVQIGTTAENQEELDRRMPHLARVPAAVRFLSIEPQLGPVDASRWLRPRILETNDGRWMWNTDPGVESVGGTWWWGVDWIICGGESGSKARPFDLAWARSLRDQCKAAGVPFFLKQVGARAFDGGVCLSLMNGPSMIEDSHGGDESEWPADLQGCRAFP